MNHHDCSNSDDGVNHDENDYGDDLVGDNDDDDDDFQLGSVNCLRVDK